MAGRKLVAGTKLSRIRKEPSATYQTDLDQGN
jgi:hypothetical protein